MASIPPMMPSNLFTAAAMNPGDRCAHRCVMRGVLWPRIWPTAYRSTPSITCQLTAVCRSEWKDASAMPTDANTRCV